MLDAAFARQRDASVMHVTASSSPAHADWIVATFSFMVAVAVIMLLNIVHSVAAVSTVTTQQSPRPLACLTLPCHKHLSSLAFKSVISVVGALDGAPAGALLLPR